MDRIAIIVGNPRSGSYCDALSKSYAEGARAAGHQVQEIVLSKMAFDVVLHVGFSSVQELEPDLKRAHSDVIAADHLVIIYPLWLGGMPALLKGFLERVLQPDLIGPANKGKRLKLLRGKTARIVVTMGMPAFVYRFWFGSYELKMLKRNILAWMGVKPVRTTLFGRIEAVSPARRQHWLRRMEKLGAAAK